MPMSKEQWIAELRDPSFRCGAMKVTLETCRELLSDAEVALRKYPRQSILHRQIKHKVKQLGNFIENLEQVEAAPVSVNPLPPVDFGSVVTRNL